MLSSAQWLASQPEPQRQELLGTLTTEELEALHYTWRFWARPDQIQPDDDWSVWLILAGRGYGKTRTGSETTRERVYPPGSTPLMAKGVQRIAIIGETAADARDVMVEGPSGLLTVHPPEFRPVYEPSKRRLTWPNGAVATTFNGTEPDQLRGPEYDWAWGDELAKMRYAQEVFDQLQFGLRRGDDPRQMWTTTPRAIPIIRDLVRQAERREGGVIVTRGKTTDNLDNLAKKAVQKLLTRYAGTRLGRQELDAEILDDLPGALWRREDLDRHRVREISERMARIVVAIDPSVGDGLNEDQDECGLLVCGVGEQSGKGYVLHDGSMRGSPMQWARRAVSLFDQWDADAMVAEVNQGGAMVRDVIQSVRLGQAVNMVRATRGKHVRAEPVAALYEQGRIAHLGSWSDLEDQLCLMTTAGFEGVGSPDRADALVWAFTDLFGLVARGETGPDEYDWRAARPGLGGY
jgi:phage terminase large subunit-like protein